jgi:hypothetical protein
MDWINTFPNTKYLQITQDELQINTCRENK